MFFAAAVTPSADAHRRRGVIAAHAAWAGLAVERAEVALADGRILTLAWLLPSGVQAPTVQRDAGTARIRTAGAGPGRFPNAALVEVDEATGRLQVTLPLATPEHVFAVDDGSGWTVANDLRLVARLVHSLDPDPRAVAALLQYGWVPAPFSLLRGVQQLAKGCTWTARPGQAATIQLSDVPAPPEVGGPPKERVRAVLDASLSRVPAGSVLTFSGGVDSGLLAARAAAVGRQDITLLNYGFGAGDPEAALAAEMAAVLGLPFERVDYRPEQLGSALARVTRRYSAPFTDMAWVASSLLVDAALPLLAHGGALIDGVGADGAFGLVPKLRQWETIYRLPLPVRHAVDAHYRRRRLWEQGGRAEMAGRLIRRSLQLPIEHAALAQNALRGLVYDVAQPAVDEMEQALIDHADGLAAGWDRNTRFSLLDLVHLCAGKAAAKVFDPLRHAGVEAVYPFLEPDVIGLSLALPWEVKNAGGELKAVLKELLVESVPREWVYRRKQGFVPPNDQMLAQAEAQELFADVVLSQSNPLAPYLRTADLRRLVDRVRAGRPVSPGAYNLLWGTLFTSCWFDQLDRAAGADVAGVA